MTGIWAGRKFHNWAIDGRNDLAWLTRFDLGTSTARSWDLTDRHNLGSWTWISGISWHNSSRGLFVEHTIEDGGCSNCPVVAQRLNTMIFIPIWWQTNDTLSSIFGWSQAELVRWGLHQSKHCWHIPFWIVSWLCRWWLSGQVEYKEKLLWGVPVADQLS